MTRVFLPLAFAEAAILAALTGEESRQEHPVSVENYDVIYTLGFVPVVTPAQGRTLAGIAVDLPGADALARLNYALEALWGAATEFAQNGDLLVPHGAAAKPAEAHPDAAQVLARMLPELMVEYPKIAAAGRHAILPAMLGRAASGAVAAKGPGPGQNREFTRDDVEIVDHRKPYNWFFRMEEYDVRIRRFDGTLGAPTTRAVFRPWDAVMVLPYDPVRDRVLVVEQFRAGPYARGDQAPWMTEPIAGLIDAGETPQATAFREAGEEAGLELRSLELVSQSYPSPGGSADFFTMYVGIADLPDGIEGVGGLVSEEENIRSSLMAWDIFLAKLDADEFWITPLVVIGHWLARHRERLRANPSQSA